MIKNLAKSFLNIVWNFKKSGMDNRIIYYHSVHPGSKRSHRSEMFEKQLNWLKKYNYSTVLVKEIPKILNKEITVDEPWVAITFDDGYRDNFKIALPILKKLGFKATFFIATKYLSTGEPVSSNTGHRLYEDREMLTNSDLIELHENGMEIASHTYSHRMATKVYDESPDQLFREMNDSKEQLENIIGDEVISFSYPNGQKGSFSNGTKNLLKKSGYKVGCTTIWGPIANDNLDLLELPRCEISNLDSLIEFQAKMVGKRDYLRFVHKTIGQSKVWND